MASTQQGLTYDFGQQKDLVLLAAVNPKDLLMISGIVIVVRWWQAFSLL